MGRRRAQRASSRAPFNRRYRRCGHVFQARFRSILVDTDSYLLRVCRYVVLNPVRARLCRQPEQWLWSSYRQTAGIDPPAGLVAVDRLLARFAPTRARAQAAYRRFVADGLGDRLEEQIVGERLGSDKFLSDRFGHQPDIEIPQAQLQPLPPPLEELFSNGDQTPIMTAYRQHGYTLRQIAEHLGCHYSTISRKLRQQETAPNA